MGIIQQETTHSDKNIKLIVKPSEAFHSFHLVTGNWMLQYIIKPFQVSVKLVKT